MKIPPDLVTVIKNQLGKDYRLVSLCGDASHRQYWQVLSKSNSLILCYDKDLIEKEWTETPQGIVHNLLDYRGVSVPHFYYTEAGYSLQEDGGSVAYDIMDKISDIKKFYETALDELLLIQSVSPDGSHPFQIAFDEEKLNFETDFFIKHFVQGYCAIDDNGFLKELKSLFSLINELLFQPDKFVLSHRDYHCKNILYLNQKIMIIDYQDARLGLPQYDVVSLLQDPYCMLEDDLRKYLIDYYFSKMNDELYISLNRNDFDYLYEIMAFQRNVKAIGSYGFLVTEKSKPEYEKFILPAVRYLKSYGKKSKEVKEGVELILEKVENKI